ncbi:hypothetical protein F5B19DRAFT_442207 [Rostrohypoxylon terebratum]|nr:hypothetical protein F5B19DRAFT_442207 [Rostrohypoxylon terebratum]
MDEDSIDIEAEAWRQDCLGDEPIYCAAPLPSNPDDIICYGSDEELDEDAKIAKRLRYETQGLRYLQGKPIRIFSAALHGPFEKASGWTNPWLPKQPAAQNPVPTYSHPASRPFPAIKQRIRRFLEYSDIMPDTSDSMRYHLPTPESNRESQLSGSPPELDKTSRIKAWAKDVPQGEVLGKDPFWAPSLVTSEESFASSKKRPAVKDWLRKQSKRKRLDTQDATRASTPTPLNTTTRPATRLSPMPTSINQTSKPTYPRELVSQSFELTTPSSTTHQSVSEVPYISSGHHAVSPHANPSEVSQASEHENGWGSNAENSEIQDDAKQSLEYPSNKQTDQRQNADDAASENYIDESFHYRTRPTKKVVDVEKPMVDVCPEPEPAQTMTPSSAVDIAVREIMEPPRLLQSSPISKQQVPMDQVATSQRARSLPALMYYHQENGKEYFSIPSRSKVGVYNDHQPLVEDSNSTHSYSREDLEPPENASTLHVKDDGIDERCPAQNDIRAIQALRDDKVSILPSVLGEAEVHLREDQSVVKGICHDDPMDVDGNMLHEANPILTSHHKSKSPTPEATAKLDEPTDTTMSKEVQESEPDIDSSLVIIPISRSEWGVAEVSDESPEEPRMVDGSKANISIVKAEEGLDEDDPSETTLSEPPNIIQSQSPWVSELAPGGDLTIEHVKAEPVDDIPSPPSCLSHYTLLSSQPSGHGTPMIRPSQQSPWGGGLLEPPKFEQHGHLTDVEAISPDTHHGTPISPPTQSPWAKSSTSAIPTPQLPSLSPAPMIFNKKQLQPNSQSPMAAIGLNTGLPEQSPNDGPTTPPQVTTGVMRTPDLEKSIKSFAMFKSPSPKYSVQQSTRQFLSTGRKRGGILSSPNSVRSSRRVTFALLPDDEDGTEPQQSCSFRKTASPPPQTIVDAEDEDVGEHFHNHFDIMKRRASGEKIRRPSRPLLPSASQQMPISPAVGAMAEAFRGADAYISQNHGTPIAGDGAHAPKGNPNLEQSPWQKDSQGVDDVAEVMNNLDDFLNAWDVEAELQKARQEPNEENRDWDIGL